MSESLFPVAQFQTMRTPFYYYDTVLLDQTLQAIKAQTDLHEGYHLHYAVKACANPKVLVNVSGSSPEDYAECAARIDALPGIPGIELNISCPNVKSGGMAFGVVLG